MLQLLEDPVALQDVDDAEEQEESLALVVSSRNATRPEMENVNSLHKRPIFNSRDMFSVVQLPCCWPTLDDMSSQSDASDKNNDTNYDWSIITI